MYPCHVTSNYLMLEQSGIGKSRVNSNNKSLLLHVGDGAFDTALSAATGGLQIQATTSQWADVPAANTNLFDPQAEYRVLNANGHSAGTTMYPCQVTPNYLMLEQSGDRKSRVNSNNKSLLEHVGDGAFDTAQSAATGGLVVQMKLGEL
jgi:hypothetical protein